ncbi:MAG: EpsG family protein [Abditibacteriota bacterium]|nr:EpsG family protein [Abditibacteriota bacterium]
MNLFIVVPIWLLVLYFLTKNNKQITQSSLLVRFLVCVPLILFATFRGTAEMNDTGSYVEHILNTPLNMGEFLDYLSDRSDKLFYIIIYIFKLLNSNWHFVLFGIATAQILIISRFFKNYSISYLLSILIFVLSGDYTSFILFGMKQGLAIAISLLSIPFFMQKKWIPAILIILIAAQIHASLYFIIPLMFFINDEPFSKKTLLITFGFIIFLATFSQFSTFIAQYWADHKGQEFTGDFFMGRGMNATRLVFDIPFLLALFNYKKIQNIKDPVLAVCINGAMFHFFISVLACFTTGVFVGRFAWCFAIFNSVLLPWELENLFENKDKKLMYPIFIVLYILIYTFLLFYYETVGIKQFDLPI